MPLTRRRGVTILHTSPRRMASVLAAPTSAPSDAKPASKPTEKNAFRDRFAGLPAGHPTLAAKMEIVPTSSMFRRFGALTSKNSLYLQCELCTLEKQLRKLELRDSQSDQGLKAQYVKDARRLTKATKDRDGDTEQRSLINLIRLPLNEYSMCIPS
jgi:hypothetical protein